MRPFPVHRCSIDTVPVPPEERVSYWEERCRQNLVSFRCSPHAEEGLLAQQICADAGSLRVGRTRANAHVIERTPESIRAFPRESIFVNLILSGGVFAYQRGHAAKLAVGDMLAYDARYPYLLGGAPSFELIHLDIPAELFRARFGREDMSHPLQVTSADGAKRLYHRALLNLLLDVVDGRHAAKDDPHAIDDQVCDLLAGLMGQATGRGTLSALSVGHLLVSKEFIEQRLDDDRLCAQDIAAHVGISERHLRRLFAAQDTSIAEYVLNQRLERAHRALQDPMQRSATVAETAYRWGFASHAHFSRTFKQRFGITPSELLRNSH